MNDVDGCEIIEPTMATTNGNFHRSKNKNQRKLPLLISQAERKKKKLKRTSAKMSNKKAKLGRNSFDDSLADEQMETAEDVSILEEESLIVDTTAISAVLHGKERFAIFPCTLMSDAHIVLFPSKSKLQIFGSFEVQALFGDVSIDGYLCKAGQTDDTRWIPVVAPWKTSPPVVIKCPLSHAKAPKLSRLQWRLKQVTDQVDEVLAAYSSGFSVVLLRSYSPPACSLIKEMYGVVFYKPLPGKTPNYLHLNKTCCIPRGALRDKYDGELRDVIDDVFSAIAAKKDSLLHSVTAILGAKGAGKSTLVRLLSNLLIREDSPPVYLLDTDVGQSETTPPGCLSLIKLDKPLLGLAANNQQATFAETYFFGDVTPATLRQRYLSAVRRLVDSFRKNAPPGSPLIVNTHGWLSGLGIPLMHEILAISEPNFIFHLRTRGPEVDEFDREIIPSSCEMLWEAEKPSPPQHLPGPLASAAQLRDMQMAAYLASMLTVDSAKVAAIVDLPPFAVRWSSVGVWLPADSLCPDEQVMNVLNASVVALCRVDEGKLAKRFMDDDSLPWRLDSAEESPLRCVGFGLIRAIDMEQKLFFVLTPVDRAVLSTVNVFARGVGIDLPSAFLFAQSSPTPAPYVVRPQNIKAPAEFHGFHKELRPMGGYKRSRRPK